MKPKSVTYRTAIGNAKNAPEAINNATKANNSVTRYGRMNGTMARRGFKELPLGRFMSGECGGISENYRHILFLSEAII